jgi:serine/threonine protein kinase
MRTALGFQARSIDGERPIEGSDFPDAMLRRIDSPRTMQMRPIRITPVQVRLSQPPLGRGAYGVAYRCNVRDQNLVVKVPLEVAPRRGVELPEDADVDRGVRLDFDAEFRNAERLLEPASFSRATALSAQEARAILDEMDTMRAHPGYAHMHRIVHYERAPYPMLFSEPCAGTLWERLQSTDWSTDSPEWRELACQLLSAFDYTRTRGLFHVDIKPDNVFYIGQRYMLADFGLASTAHHDRSAAQVCATLVAALGANLRLKATVAQPRPPFDRPLRRIARTPEEATSVLPQLWEALGLRDFFEPYPVTDTAERIVALQSKRPLWMVERDAREALEARAPEVRRARSRW